MAAQRGRADREPPLAQEGGDDAGIVGLGQSALEPGEAARLLLGVVGRRRRAVLLRRAAAYDLVYRGSRLGEAPPVLFLDQHQAGAGAALIAVVRPGAVLIVEPVAIPAAAERAGAVLAGEELSLNPEQRQNLTPAPAGALNRAGHADLRA